MKKRLVIKSKFRFCTFICTLVLLFMCSFGIISAKADNVSPREPMTIQIQTGDTLWDIAKENAPSGIDIREYIYHICELNNITPDQLHSGMTVALPTNL